MLLAERLTLQQECDNLWVKASQGHLVQSTICDFKIMVVAAAHDHTCRLCFVLIRVTTAVPCHDTVWDTLDQNNGVCFQPGYVVHLWPQFRGQFPVHHGLCEVEELIVQRHHLYEDVGQVFVRGHHGRERPVR